MSAPLNNNMLKLKAAESSEIQEAMERYTGQVKVVPAGERHPAMQTVFQLPGSMPRREKKK